MAKKYAVVCVGEALIDVVSKTSEDGKKALMEGNPGGAPANVMAMVSKLGMKSAIIGKVGSDSFGGILKKAISDGGVDIGGIVTDTIHPTTLAMVTLDASGNRSFAFYRTKTADVELTPDEVDYSLIDECEMFEFGSVTLTTEPARSATFAAAEYAKKHGVPVAYDPNLRRPLWASMEEAKEVMTRGMEYADIAKVSDEELFFLQGDGDLSEKGIELCNRFGLKFLVVTMGAKGCMFVMNGKSWKANTFDTKVVDTTGSGDAYWGATLVQYLELKKDVSELTEKEIRDLMDFSNAAGSLCATGYGAIPSMPSREAIYECIKTVPYLVL